ncbi:hypothetical protein [uncultured Succinatimonas sp.]|mgnify:CR=1 FL=1|uniref:hypothetical protein n=1 Tax=uncultured Succinatimonas sp. TaxID=1262973 RepID=UPI0025F8652B|nr:hypothetical protein [uncultured Succinatimonas sp.]
MHCSALSRSALAATIAFVCAGSLIISSNVYAKDYDENNILTSKTLFVPDSAVSFKQIDDYRDDDDWDYRHRKYQHRRHHRDYDDDDDDWEDDDDDWDDDWDEDRRYRGRYGDSDDLSDDLEDDEPWDDD